MKKIEVKICNGTTCFVMGSSKFQEFEDKVPARFRKFLDIRTKSCLDLCQNNRYSKSPYVMVDDEVVSEATVEKVLEAIERKIQENISGENDEK